MFKRIVLAVVLLASLPIACSSTLSEAQFCDRFVQSMKSALPGVIIDKKSDTELDIDYKGNTNTVYLDNAYKNYHQSPANLDKVIQDYVKASIDAVSFSSKYDKQSIMPVVKDVTYLEEVKKAMKAKGGTIEKFSLYYEPINSTLLVMFVEDTENSMRYLDEQDFKKYGISKQHVRGIAIGNLKRKFSKLQIEQKGNVYLVLADGIYESSTILLDDLLNDYQKKVKGNLLVAVPARDTVMLFSSQDQSSIAAVKEINHKLATTGAYFITETIFIYSNGKLVPYEG